jgi:protein phosphatase methylesterase 1
MLSNTVSANVELPRMDSSSKPPKRSLFGSSDLSPLSASAYFVQALQIDPHGYPCSFRVYYTPSNIEISSTSASNGKKASLLVCHHGAGSSGTTFATLAKEVQSKSMGQLGVLAFDARGHGELKDDRLNVFDR